MKKHDLEFSSGFPGSSRNGVIAHCSRPTFYATVARMTVVLTKLPQMSKIGTPFPDPDRVFQHSDSRRAAVFGKKLLVGSSATARMREPH